MNDNWELLELSARGYCCSQVMVASALSIIEEENPRLIQAAGALCEGGHSGLTCGALTGGGCFMAILHESKAPEMIQKLNQWFLTKFESSDCGSLVGSNPQIKAERCPLLISEVYNKCLDLLEAHGYEG